MNKRREGNKGEEIAAAFLEGRGYQILDRNFYTSFGELDIVARENGALVFVEVKYRKNTGCGAPEEAVDKRKQRRIYNAAVCYLHKKRLGTEVQCRFDVVAIEGDTVKLYVNAFEG